MFGCFFLEPFNALLISSCLPRFSWLGVHFSGLMQWCAWGSLQELTSSPFLLYVHFKFQNAACWMFLTVICLFSCFDSLISCLQMKYRERVIGLMLVSPLCRAPSWTEWLYNKVCFLLPRYIVCIQNSRHCIGFNKWRCDAVFVEFVVFLRNVWFDEGLLDSTVF